MSTAPRLAALPRLPLARFALPGLAALALVAGWPLASALDAADHGQMGETFPIIEADLLATISARLSTLEASGGLAALQQRMREQAVASVRRPRPVAGLSPASVRREWLFDPSVVLEEDITDAKGNLIASKGTRANPLTLTQMRQALVFVDGDNEAEVAWAVRQWSAGAAKIVFVAGSPFDAMKPWQRRFYFDQGGQLTARFGIRHTPAVVSGNGLTLKVAELPLPRGAAPAAAKPPAPARPGSAS